MGKKLTAEEAAALGLPVAGAAKRKLSLDEAKSLGLPVQDVPAPKSAPLTPDQVVERLSGKRDVGVPEAGVRGFVQGAWKGGFDELAGFVGQKGNLLRNLLHGVDARDAQAREQDDYRAYRNESRRNMDAGRDQNPWTTFVSEMAGDIGSDAVLASTGVPVNSKAYMIGTGALSGLLNSDAELTHDKATAGDALSAGLSTAAGGALSWALPEVGKKLGGTSVGKYISKKLSRAQGEIDQKAAENLVKTGRSLGSDLGNEAKRSHTAMREMEEKALQGRLTPEERAVYSQIKASPDQYALDRSIIGNSIETLQKAPTRVGMAKDAVNELRENAPKLLEDLKDQYGNHPFKRTIFPFLARYAAPMTGALVSGLGVGGATNSVLAGIGGAIAGGLGTNRYVRKGAKNALGRGADEVADVLGHEAPDVAQKIKDRIAAKYTDALGKVGGQDAIPGDVGSAVLSALMGGAQEIVSESAGAGARPAIRAAQRIGVAPDVRKMYWGALGAAAKKLGDPLSKYGALLVREAQRNGIDAAMALEYALSKGDPEYGKQKEERLRSLSGAAQ